jgi:hypothetical protein
MIGIALMFLLAAAVKVVVVSWRDGPRERAVENAYRVKLGLPPRY